MLDVLLASIALALAQPDIQLGTPFNASPAPVATDDRAAWWRDARFGMFIHWGVYAELAGEFGGATCKGTSEWIMESLKIPVSKYEAVAGKLNPNQYDPASWMKAAREAGMKYVVVTAKHHDGFCLWDSKVTDWDVSRTPGKKDLIAPLAEAARAEGLRFGVYYSIMDWHHPDYAPRRAWNDKTKSEPAFQSKYVPFVHAQVEELLRAYTPDILWFDGEWEPTWTTTLGAALENRIRQIKPDVLINNRLGKSRDDMAGLNKPGEAVVGGGGDFATPEQEIPGCTTPGDWETCMTMNSSWGYKASDTKYKSAEQIVRALIETVSKGGNFLLNVGPKSDGTLPPECVERLQAVGTWMKLNGEAIYGTTASPFLRLPFGYCTKKPGALYLLVTEWPKTGDLFLPGLRTPPRSATILGQDWMQVGTHMARDGVYLSGIPPLPAFPFATVIRLNYDKDANIVADPPLAKADDTGTITCAPVNAFTSGRVRLENEKATPNLGHWTGEHSHAWWFADVPKNGRYRVEASLACADDEAGDTFTVSVNGLELDATVTATGSWKSYATLPLGEVVISVPSNRVEVRVSPKPGLKGALMNLRFIRLVPMAN